MSETAVLPGFSIFPLLPLELRELIWKTALPCPRTITFLATKFEEDGTCNILEHNQYEEDCYGKTMDEDDTRFAPEKNLDFRQHITCQGLSGGVKVQTQLHRYGFTPVSPAPHIRHVPAYESLSFSACRWYKPNLIPPSRNVQSLVHVWKGNSTGLRMRQTQLQSYGFTSSCPLPVIRHVHNDVFNQEERAIRFRSVPGPVLLYVCRESRHLAMRCGYTIAFSTRWAPAQTWFNFQTDYLRLSLPCYIAHGDGREYDVEDRSRVRRIAINGSYIKPNERYLNILQNFRNLDELLVVLECRFYFTYKDNYPDRVYPDCTIADVMANPYNYFSTRSDFLAAKNNAKAHPDGRQYFEAEIKTLERYMLSRLEQVREQGNLEFKIPKIRVVVDTDEVGEKEVKYRRALFLEREQVWPLKERYDELGEEETSLFEMTFCYYVNDRYFMSGDRSGDI